MKIQRFNEKYVPSNDEEMKNYIQETISAMIDVRQIPYTDDEWEIDPKSIALAASENSAKKYNL